MLLALLTAIVVLLQIPATMIRFGMFQVSAVLVPIVIGAALINKWAGAWLGLVFGFAVLAIGIVTSDPGLIAFIAVNPAGAIFIVLIKGALAGLLAGLVYRIFQRQQKSSRTVAVVLAAATAPIVNTGVFVIGCYLFFFETIAGWAGGGGGLGDVTLFIVATMIGLNFVFELGLNIVLAPVIVRLVQLGQDRMRKA